MARPIEDYRGSFDHVVPQMQHEETAAGVVSLVDSRTRQRGRQIVLVTGLAAPEVYMNRLGRKLQQAGHTTYDLEHFIPANIVYRVERSIEEKLDRVAQATGEAPDAVGYSLGGTMLARVKERNSHFAEGKLITVASPISPLFGIGLSDATHGESIFTPLDTIVPWALSVNPDFAEHHSVFFSSHVGIIHRQDVARLITTTLARSEENSQHGLELHGQVLSLHDRLPSCGDVFDGVAEVAAKAASVIPLFGRIKPPQSHALPSTAAA